MPRNPNTKSLNTNLTPTQIAAIEAIYPGNKAALIRQLLKQYVEQNGGTWPNDLTPRGKHERKK